MFISDSEYIIRMRRVFHQHPELGFQEFETAKIIISELEKMEVPYKSGIGGTGIVVQLGTGHPHIAFRTEMDALPIEEANDDIDYASKIPGQMHACGHDGHMAIMLHTVKQAKSLCDAGKLSGKVSFIFQPCEETRNEQGQSGAQIMLLEEYLQDVDHFFACSVESTFESGKIFVRDNAVTSAIDRFDIDIVGKAGHGAYPHKAVDPIWITSHVLTAINSIQSRCVDTISPSIISVCSVNGGDAWNAIPEKVVLSGTIRTFDQSIRNNIHERLSKCVQISELMGGTYKLDILRGNPTVVNAPNMSAIVRRCAASVVGVENVVDVPLQMGGDDFSYYSIDKPSCFFYFGAKRDSISRQHHSSNFNIDENVLVKFSNVFYNIIENFLIG
ncbi:MAG: amidohydrolase [Oscillospiraceae bacterium]|nr:amidohydrolase [Oscillospiraceae bacterium]